MHVTDHSMQLLVSESLELSRVKLRYLDQIWNDANGLVSTTSSHILTGSAVRVNLSIPS